VPSPVDPSTLTSPIAIIAGAGQFPFFVAREAKRQGLRVVVLGMQGWVDPALAAQVDAYEELAVGQLRQLVERLKAHNVRQAIMAGKVTKEVLVGSRPSFDPDMLGLLSRVKDFSVATLLAAVAQRLAEQGIILLDSSTLLKGNLCPEGVLTSRGPTKVEEEDIRVGWRAARAMATLDIGQTVVVKERVVIAVEALEGTDAAIHRAHTLAGNGLVVVKVAALQHDRRFDLPIVGTQTMATLQTEGVSCLALEAQTTVLLEREALIAQANGAKICLIGMTAPAAA